MAIVKMDKFHLFSLDHDHEDLLNALQKFEYVHFNDLVWESNEQGVSEVKIPEKLIALNERRSRADRVLEILEPYRKKLSAIDQYRIGKKELTFDEMNQKASTYDFDKTYHALDECMKRIHALEQENQSIGAEIEDLEPWKGLDIAVEELYSLKSVDVLTGMLPVKNVEGLKSEISKLTESYVEKISSRNGNAYVLVIVTDEEKDLLLDLMRLNGFVPVTIKSKMQPNEKIRKLKSLEEENEKQIDIIKDNVKGYIDQYEELQIYKDYLNNLIVKESARENFLTTDMVNIIEGYIPSTKKTAFEKTLKDILKDRYFVEIAEADRDDPDVPIILKNNSFSQAFEQVTAMYSLPRYNEIDPTPLLAPFYAFFAGMMIGDAGYGLTVLLASTFALKMFHFDKGMKDFLRFFRFISIGAVFWGSIYNSFFGMSLPFYNAVLDMSKDTMKFMVLCLVFAFIHLFFGLAIKGYMNIRDGKPLDALYDVGFWMMLLIGLILLMLGSLATIPAIVTTIAKGMAIISAIGIIATGGRDEKSPVAKFGWGAYSLYGVSSWLGDFVSYMRLMALGLSGAYIAIAINMIVGMMVKANIPMLIIGAIIFIVFQLFNLFLSYLSAYVHTARLTFVEMFNKFYEGGGKPFKKMIEESKYFNLKNRRVN